MNNIEITRTRPTNESSTFKYEVILYITDLKGFDDDFYHHIEDHEGDIEYLHNLVRPVFNYISEEVFGIEVPIDQDIDTHCKGYPIDLVVLDEIGNGHTLTISFELPQPFPISSKALEISKFLKEEPTALKVVDIALYPLINPREIKS